MRRLAFILPIIALMIPFVVPMAAEAVTIPNCTVAAVSCGNGDYYCPNHKGENCKNPSYSTATYNLNQSIARRAATTPPAKKGVVYKSTSVPKVTYKYVYVTKKVCSVQKGKKVCVKKRVRSKVAVKK